jgi:hypothetical protein
MTFLNRETDKQKNRVTEKGKRNIGLTEKVGSEIHVPFRSFSVYPFSVYLFLCSSVYLFLCFPGV